MVRETHLAVGAEHTVQRVSRRPPLGNTDRIFRLEPCQLLRRCSREQTQTHVSIEVEVAQACRISFAPGEKRQAMQPAKLMADTLVPAYGGKQRKGRTEHVASEANGNARIVVGIDVAVV